MHTHDLFYLVFMFFGFLSYMGYNMDSNSVYKCLEVWRIHQQCKLKGLLASLIYQGWLHFLDMSLHLITLRVLYGPKVKEWWGSLALQCHPQENRMAVPNVQSPKDKKGASRSSEKMRPIGK